MIGVGILALIAMASGFLMGMTIAFWIWSTHEIEPIVKISIKKYEGGNFKNTQV